MTTVEAAVLREDRGQGRDRCALLTLHRPRVLNAISNEMVGQLESQLDLIERDDSRVLVMTGSGRAFCSGTDLSAHADDTLARMKRMHRLVTRLQNLSKVSIAAVNGIAYGGGLELAIGCTFRIAAPDARFALPEIKLGLMPLYGGTALLPELIGKNRALEMMLSGDAIDAQTALAIGLVNRVSKTPQTLLEEAVAYAAQLGQHSTIPREALRTLASRHGEHATLAEQLADEVAVAGPVIASEDAREGVAAFLEKRKAVVIDK